MSNNVGISPEIRMTREEFKKPVVEKKRKGSDGESSFKSESLSSVGGTRETVTLDDIKNSKKIE